MRGPPQLLGHEPGFVEDHEPDARSVAADLPLRGGQGDDLGAVREPDASAEGIDDGSACEAVALGSHSGN